MKNLLRTLVVAGALFISAISLPALATPIFLAGDSNIFVTNEDNEVFFQNVFNGQSVANYSSNSLAGLGTTASETNYGAGATITSTGLSGKDFMIFGHSRVAVSANELTAIADYYNGGGSLFLFGEGNQSFLRLNNAVNSILSVVGSTMSLSTTENFDISGFTTLTDFVGTGAFAVGVNSWITGFTSKINLGSGQAVISGRADAGFFGVAIGLENGSSPPPGAVPAPATLALLGLGLAGLGWSRRKKA